MNLLLTLVLTSAADPPPPPVTAQEKSLTIRAAKLPERALLYPLLPEPRETMSGNAAQLYYRAFAPEWDVTRRDPKHAEKLEAAMKKPPRELAKEPNWTSLVNPAQLREIDRAARCSYCEWDMEARLREDGGAFLLPDVQGLRTFARSIALRTRKELGEGDFRAAHRSLQTGFSLGRHTADAPILISALVGVAIAGMTLDQVEEWVQTPGSPNLYWSLTDLPRPFVDLRRPLLGERIMLDPLLPGIRAAVEDPKAATLPQYQLDVLQKKLFENLSLLEGIASEGRGQRLANALGGAWWLMTTYPLAKEYWTKRGRPAAEVAKLPPLQAVLMYELAEYDRVYDEMLKWRNLPYSQAKSGIAEVERSLKAERAKGTGGMLAGLMLPAVSRVPATVLRLNRRIDMLRCVEAIRLHLAATGTVPAKLSDLTTVPVPEDPLTGKPFGYEVAEGKVILTAGPPDGEKPSPTNALRYTLTVAK